MNITKALEHLGVRSDLITDDERAFLDVNGYLPLPAILSPQQVREFNARLDAIFDAEGDMAGSEFKIEPGAGRLCDLVNKDPMFQTCYTHPRVLAAIAHVLDGDMKLSSLNCRFAQPGLGLQALHADWNGAVAPGEYQVCNSIWLLSDFTETNGATRVVPGSHRSGKTPQDVMYDAKADHPDQLMLLGEAGTVVVFNSHTWHGGTLNQTKQPRRAMHSYFTRRHNSQQTDQRKYATAATRARCSAAAQFLLDID